MSESHLWAAIAILALAGWAFTNIFHTKVGVSQANMFSILEKLDDRMDGRIRAILERAKGREEKKMPQQPPSVERANPLADLIGDRPFISGVGIGEQPEAESLDIVQ